jgi:hypothetical protein
VVVADRADAIRQLAAGRLDVVAQVPAAEAVAAAQLHPALVRFRYRQPAALVAVITPAGRRWPTPAPAGRW